MVAAPLRNGHRIELRWARIAVAGDGRTWSWATVDDRMRGGALKMQELTRMMIGCSMLSIGVGDNHKFVDSSEVLRKGMMKSSWSRTLLDAMLPLEDIDVEAELSRYSTNSGVVGNGG
jgi:hypothetical protein